MRLILWMVAAILLAAASGGLIGYAVFRAVYL
jgi:hypothetical protein